MRISHMWLGTPPSIPNCKMCRVSVTCRASAASNTLRVPPPRTCSQAVTQARAALRTFRDARAAGFQPSGSPQELEQFWLTVELPLPVQRSLVNPFAASSGSAEADLIVANDESDWPGGIQQRFRTLRPLVDQLIEGYSNSNFLGLLESDADGVGLWSCGNDMTLCSLVTNPTFPTLVKLLDGGYGSRVLSPGHTVLAINPSWGTSKEIGQFWERSLRRRAAEIMGEVPRETTASLSSQEAMPTEGDARPSSTVPRPAQWEALYHCRIVRTSRGNTGLLHRSWPGPWRLYAAPAGNASEIGELVLKSDRPPSPQQLVSVLSTVGR